MQTAISRLLCALVFVYATGRMASAKDVLITSGATTRPRVDIVFDGPLASRRLEVLALKEAALIWAAHGVDVGGAKADDR